MTQKIESQNEIFESTKQTFPKVQEADSDKLKKIPITKFYKRIKETKNIELYHASLKFDVIKEAHFNNSTIRTTILDFFNTYHKITRNPNFNNALTNFLEKHKNIINKPYLFEQCLTLLAYNGHEESVNYVKSLFKNEYNKFNEINTTLTNKISNETKHLDNLSKKIEPEKVEGDKKLSSERNQNLEKDADKYNNNKAKKNKPIMNRIVKLKTRKENKLNDFISSINPIIHFYYLFIQNRLLDDNFDVHILDNTFLVICRDLHDLSKTENLQNIANNSIQEKLNSIIADLITAFSNTEQKNKNSQRAYTQGHLIKLDQLYQSLFEYTSYIETKRNLLDAYKNENYPIASYIIKEALNNEITLQDEYKDFIIGYIEHKYKQIKNENIEGDLKKLNLEFIQNTNFPENIRKKAFNWYFNSEIIDNDKKTEFCWEIIKFIDKQNKFDSCYREIYNKCEEYLIINETEDKILENLQEFLDSDESKGRICSFINGVLYSNIQNNFFSVKAGKYVENFDKETIPTYNKKPWIEREKRIKCETQLIED